MRKYTTVREAVTAAVNEGTEREEREERHREFGMDSDFGWWLANHWRRHLGPTLYSATDSKVAREI